MTGTVQAGIVSVATIVGHPSNLGRDLGDLRSLAANITKHGVLVPVVVEKHFGKYRLRDGHRRLAAAKMAKVTRVPAIIHSDELDEIDWLLESAAYNEHRAGFTPEDRTRVAQRLVELGVSRAGIAEAFGVGIVRLRTILGEQPGTAPVRTAPRSDRRKLSNGKIRHLIDDWRQRDADRDTVLAELLAFITPEAAE